MHCVEPTQDVAGPVTGDGNLRMPPFSIRGISSRDRGSRDGASIVLIVIMLLTFVILAGITIDYAYMMLIKKELQVVTDAATKAGAIALADTKSANHARNVAIYTAGRMTVAGEFFKIRRSDVQVGSIQLQADKSWKFIDKARPLNAVRVNSRVGGNAVQKAIPLYFGGVTGFKHFKPETYAVAGQPSVAISICLDRSGSMLFDLTGREYSFPPDNPFFRNRIRDKGQNKLIQIPHPRDSRWAVLMRSIDRFFDELKEMAPHPRVGLVTWAGYHHEQRIDPPIVFHDSALDYSIRKQGATTFQQDRRKIQGIMDDYGKNIMMGYTRTSAGLNQSRKDLNRKEISDFHRKIIVLFTDGLWNIEVNPVESAKKAAEESITIYVVSMLANGTSHRERDMRDVARITGGEYFTADNEVELETAFKNIASLISTVITE